MRCTPRPVSAFRYKGNVATKVDVRIIAATHKDLRAEIDEGRFREDLFYRLNVIPVHLPPLRERPDDIPALAEAFVRKHSSGERRTLSAAAIQRLQAFPWRGNARELENVIERALALSDQPELGPDDLPIEAAARGHAADVSGGLVAAAAARRLTLREVEVLYTEEILKLTGGNKTEAVALAMRRLLDAQARAGSLFGAHPGSVRVREGVDLTAPILDVEPDAETGREIER